MFLRKFAFRKLGADSKPSYVCKTDSSCPLLHLSIYASLPAANLVRTANQTISVEPSYPVRHPLRTPKQDNGDGVLSPMFLCVICYGKSRAGGNTLSLSMYVFSPDNKKTHGEEFPVRSV